MIDKQVTALLRPRWKVLRQKLEGVVPPWRGRGAVQGHPGVQVPWGQAGVGGGRPRTSQEPQEGCAGERQVRAPSESCSSGFCLVLLGSGTLKIEQTRPAISEQTPAWSSATPTGIPASQCLTLFILCSWDSVPRKQSPLPCPSPSLHSPLRVSTLQGPRLRNPPARAPLGGASQTECYDLWVHHVGVGGRISLLLKPEYDSVVRRNRRCSAHWSVLLPLSAAVSVAVSPASSHVCTQKCAAAARAALRSAPEGPACRLPPPRHRPPHQQPPTSCVPKNTDHLLWSGNTASL